MDIDTTKAVAAKLRRIYTKPYLASAIEEAYQRYLNNDRKAQVVISTNMGSR